MMDGNGVLLSDEQKKAVEVGIATHMRVQGDLEKAKAEISVLRQDLKEQEVEINSLKSLSNMLESRIEGCIAERDRAADRAIKLDALFSMMMATMLKFEINPIDATLAPAVSVRVPATPSPRPLPSEPFRMG